MTIDDVGRVLVLVVAVVLVSACGGDEPDAEAGGQDAQEEPIASSDAGSGLSPEASRSVVDHLDALETAYLAGDRSAARAHFDEAMAAWSEVSAGVPEALATTVQLELDSLGDAVAGASPPVAVQGAVGSLSSELAPAPAAGG